MYIDDKGRKWFKGNLHTHTTRSDGQKSPEDTVALYREHCYDFIALTDHWVLSDERDDRGMLEISGCEYNIGKTAAEGIYHIVALGMTAFPDFDHSNAQSAIDAVKASGGIAVLAHPAWSLNDAGEVAKLRGLAATEIFNSVSDLPRNCRPYSGCFVDLLGVRGMFLPLIATDDTHFYMGEQCRSYIMVNTDELTSASILDAVVNGRFYATQGPRIELSVNGKTACVDCSPCNEIVLFSDSVWMGHRADVGEGLTHAEFDVGSETTFVRAEVRDSNGKTAWSNIFPI